VTEGKGNVVTKEAVLNDNDELWTELKYKHIAQVSKLIADRMKDIVQNNATAGVAKKTGGGADVSIEAMSAIVKELPQFKHQMAKLGQHVNLSSQCMTTFGRNNLMNVSQLEQTMSTGLDEEGKEFKGAKLVQHLMEFLDDPNMSKLDKIRLLAIFLSTQKSVSGSDRQNLIQAARLSGPEQTILMNFDKLGQMMQASKGPGSTGVFGGMFKGGGGTPAKARTAAAEDDGNIDTRHTCEIKTVLEAMVNGTLPTDKWAAAGPAPPVSGESKVASVRTRKFGNAGAGVHYSGGRVLAFVAGGISYSEMRVANELETQLKKEVILGGSCVMNPKEYIKCVAAMNPSSERADIFNDSSVTAAEGGQRI
jgi:predicted house-cleaning noncanonical NTP pyrophosphatase (MazG superfamily)